MVEQSKSNLGLCYCIIRDECGFEGLFDLDSGFVCIWYVFVFELGESSSGKGFSSFLGHFIEENHGSYCIGILVLMQGKVGLHGHEPSVGISSLSTELFMEGYFNFHVIIIFIGERIYVDRGAGGISRQGVWRTGR